MLFRSQRRLIYKTRQIVGQTDNDYQSLRPIKEADLYSAFIEVPSLKALRYGSHSVTCKLHRTCLYLVSIHQMAHPQTEVADI